MIIARHHPNIAQYLKWLSMNASVLDRMGGDLLCMATRRLQRRERGLLDPSSVRILSAVSCLLRVCFKKIGLASSYTLMIVIPPLLAFPPLLASHYGLSMVSFLCVVQPASC